MDSWISRSNPAKQYLLSAACALLGLVLAGVGVAGLLTTGKQSVLVDPKTRRITVEDARPFGIKKRSILFSDIGNYSGAAVFLLPLQGEGRDGDGVVAPLQVFPHPLPSPPLEGEGINAIRLRASPRPE